jgi:hypothetical protein
LFQLPQNKLSRHFIQLNNSIVLSQLHGKFNNKHVLLLIPHCLQEFECEYKLTNKVRNCRRCGRCIIKELIDFADTYNINLRVASGGTIAREFIKEYKPKIVIAVGCERELTYGIWDVYPLPVIGIVNQRPNGPCKNTILELNKLKEAFHSISVSWDNK